MSRLLVTSAFRRLAVMSGKDMLRNPLSGISMLVMFAVVLAVYVSMWLTFTVLGTAPTASVAPANQRVSSALANAGVTVVDEEDPGTNVAITLSEGHAVVVLDSFENPAWNSLWVGLRDAGVPADSITVVNDDGEAKFAPLRAFLGVAALTGFASVAFIGTTVPIVDMRERGLLRIFGTTPLRRSTFLLAQVPARIVIVVIEATIVVAIAAWRRYVDGIDLLSFGITLALGIAMLFCFTLAFAARLRNAEAAQQSMATLVILLVFTSGGILPSELIPTSIQAAMNALPTTWFAAAMNTDLTGVAPFLPIPLLWALMGASAVLALLVAARLFEWDQSEPAQRLSTRSRRKVSA